MYNILSSILSDKTGGVIFECFSIWHFLYLAVIFGTITGVVLLLKNKSDRAKKRAADIAVGIALGLYALDFFLMPFAYGEIHIEKLPFHVCTAMCVMCFLSRRVKFLEKYKGQLALLGFLSNLIYVLYPAGVEWCQTHPFSYRAAQTIIFHGAMTAYGIFVLSFGEVKLNWRKCHKELVVLSGMTVWALIGNTLYEGNTPNYYYDANWFFLHQDPFSALPSNIAPYVMPFIAIVALFAAEMVIYSVYHLVLRMVQGKQKKKEA